MILSLKEQIFNFLDKDSTQSSTVIANSTTPKTSDSYVRRIKMEWKKAQEKEVVTTTTTLKEITTKDEIILRRKDAKIKFLETNNKRLVADYEALMDQYDNALLLQEISQAIVPTIDINPSIPSEAVPIIQYSDWHVEERIEKRTTQGKNEFNPDIAKQRVINLSNNTLKLIRKERQDVTIKKLVVCLGGDFINNYLHEHDVQMNFMSPIEAAIFAKELLVMSLKMIAQDAEVDKIIIMCIRGNHGRLTRRMQTSNDYKMNLEAVLYYMLKNELTDDIYEWHIPDSELGYIKIFDKLIRSFHGHQVKFQGGVGDLSIPINKLVMKWDKTDKADWNLMHHYHSFWTPTRNTSLNGSLCGWNSYALSLGLQYEPALQTFHLLDQKRSFTVRTPIHCE